MLYSRREFIKDSRSISLREYSLKQQNPRPPRPVADRFWEKVTKTDECWVWNASTFKTGYGQFMMPGGPQKAHRVAWKLIYGNLDDDTWLLHKCNNPLCVKPHPDHVYEGTRAQNVQDMLDSNRQSQGTVHGDGFRGERHGLAKLTEARVLEARRRYAAREASIAEMAREYGCTLSALGYAIRGVTWTHLPQPEGFERVYGHARGERGGKVKLTTALVLEARWRSVQPEAPGYRELAAEYQCAFPTLAQAIAGTTWTHLPSRHTMRRQTLAQVLSPCITMSTPDPGH